jgi:hypothetical protein
MTGKNLNVPPLGGHVSLRRRQVTKASQAGKQLCIITAGKVTAAIIAVKKGVSAEKGSLFFIP